MAQLDWATLTADADVIEEFALIPDGEYDFVVSATDIKTTNNGKTMFVVKAQITSGPYKGRIIFDNITISPESPKALGFAFATFASMGLTRAYFEQRPSNDQVVTSLQGRAFRGTVGKRLYNGKDYNEIKKHSPAQAPGLVAGAATPPPPPPAPSSATPPPPPPAPTTAVNAPADAAFAVTTPVAPVAAEVPVAPVAPPAPF